MFCQRYLIGMFCLGLGIGFLLGSICPVFWFLLFLSVTLIVLGVLLLKR
ncbi:MAG: hypothetical protein KHY89_00615 [Butyricicoccus pullicaecorum]|nr:hypothetical protein [Butyricicoccus pullicaecorum]